MTDAMVSAEGLSKRYALGEMYSDLLSERLGNLLRRRKRAPAGELWALRDVNFSIDRGGILGVIGRNGAGKSTLLKILSRITAPTEGRVVVRGRLASLLEVGTGFHPELTGRENIFLNGTVLGMRRAEIKAKFDEIVAFSEVEKFLDTPVKRYSSGMYVRLAFAVAAHLDPDVLVVDEVLAVGDREFQEKCLGRMRQIAQSQGRTVLFVSHNLDVISRICTEGLYLRNGKVAFAGAIGATIDAYLGGARESSGNADLRDHAERWGNGRVRITAFELRDARNGAPVAAMSSGGDFDIVISYEAPNATGDLTGTVVSLSLADARGTVVMLVSSDFGGGYLTLGPTGRVVCRIRDLNLTAGTYSLTLFFGARGETYDCLNDVEKVAVVGGDYFGTGHPGLPEHCKVLTRSEWSVE